MTCKEFSGIMIFLGSETEDTYPELVIALCLLFHGIELNDICKLQLIDIYNVHWDIRAQIRKLRFAIPAELKAWFEDYLEFLDSGHVCYELEKLLPSYNDPIRLAEHLEDHGAIPEKVMALGRQCYEEHLDKFTMSLIVENW